MATRLDLLRKGGPVIKSFMDSVFLKNQSMEGTTDNVIEYSYKKSELVYICISTTARAISQIPIRVGKMVGDEEFRQLPLGDPWQKLFENPNYLMDRYSFVEALIGFLMLDGDVFIVPFPPGSPSSLWVVRKKFIGPIKDRTTNRLIGWNYDTKGVIFDSYGGSILTEGAIPLAVDEVCHIYFWNPYDPIMGQAPSEAGKLSILVDYKASNYTSNFFDEGAQPGGMLETDRSLTDKQFNRILQQFETKHQGYKKAHRIALLENGLKYTQVGLSQKEMEFPKLREMTARRVFQIYGMKEAIISETRTVNRATGQEERKEWWESTNLPMMGMTTSALDHTLFRNSDLRCRFDTTKVEALRQALSDKVETGYKLWQMGFTADEINDRLGFGFKSKPWRKTWYMPVNMVPIEDYIPPAPPVPSEPLQLEDIIDVEGETKLLSMNIKEEREEAIWNGFVRQVLPLEESFTKKTSRVFFNMRKRTLDLLYRKRSLEESEKDFSDLEDALYLDEIKEIRKLSEPLYKQALALGVAMIVTEIGIEVAFDFTDPESLAFLTNKELKIRGIIDTIKMQIQKELFEGYQKPETVDQVATRIRNVFDLAKGRAKTIARFEMFSTVNEGRYLAINRSGLHEKIWFTALDERVRLQHRPMHGQKIKVGEMWIMPDGTNLRHPGDFNGPPSQVIGCRCMEFIVSPSLE